MATQGVDQTKREEAEELLNQMVNSPFMCIVLTEDGNVRVFSKDITPERLARIKARLAEAMEE